MILRLKPVSLRVANAYTAEHHRHLKPARGCRFVTSVVDDADNVRGVIVVEWPSARLLNDGYSAEVTRCATDGTRNACSKLYGAARRACLALGFRRLFTSTLPQEGGASLRAAGWIPVYVSPGGEWSRPSRGRAPAESPGGKQVWSAWPLERHQQPKAMRGAE